MSNLRGLFLFGFLAVGRLSLAHHAPFIYDTENERAVTGVVESFEWVQPHVWVTLRVSDGNGEFSVWKFEGMSPLYLGRRGWNRYSLEPDDVIEVSFFPRKDGSLIGMFLNARLPDGSIKVMAVNPADDDSRRAR